jgi:crossover junction endodeoxyribonuclease RusA
MMTALLPYPISTNRIWRSWGGRIALSNEARAYKENAQKTCIANGFRPLQGRVEVRYILHAKANKDGTASKTRVDLFNCEKLIGDALNGIAYFDDKQIVRGVVELGWPMPDGGVTVSVFEAN